MSLQNCGTKVRKEAEILHPTKLGLRNFV